MSVTAGGDHSKSHKKSHKSKSTGPRADPEDLDEDKARAKLEKKKHRKPTSDALSTNLLTDHTHTVKGSTARDSSHPLNSSLVGSGNVTSNNVQLPDSAIGNSEGSAKEEKDKRDLQDILRDAREGQESRKKNKKRSRDGDKLEDASDNDASKKKRKEKKHLDDDKKEGVTQSDDTKVSTTDEVVPDKRQQKKRERITEEQLGQPGATASSNKPRKKKKGQDPTDILSPDPNADETLSDPSRKALSYAYARFQDPPNWKFNKASQIWLIRKLWSEEMIPEQYFGLVTKYLATVEGRIRDTLVQMCNSEVASVASDTSVKLGTGSTNPSEQGLTATIKVMRARSLLDALSHTKD